MALRGTFFHTFRWIQRTSNPPSSILKFLRENNRVHLQPVRIPNATRPVAFKSVLFVVLSTTYQSMALMSCFVSSRSLSLIGCRTESPAGSDSISRLLLDCVSACLLKIFLATIERRRKSDGRLSEHLGPDSPIRLACVIVSLSNSPSAVGSRNWHSSSGTYTWNYRRKKVKVALEQAMKAQRGSRGIAVLFL